MFQLGCRFAIDVDLCDLGCFRLLVVYNAYFCSIHRWRLKYVSGHCVRTLPLPETIERTVTKLRSQKFSQLGQRANYSYRYQFLGIGITTEFNIHLGKTQSWISDQRPRLGIR